MLRSRSRARCSITVAARRRDLPVRGFDPSRVGEPLINPGVIGTIENIPSTRARGVDRVVVSLVDARGKLPMDKLPR
jgi:hypothetical protein